MDKCVEKARSPSELFKMLGRMFECYDELWYFMSQRVVDKLKAVMAADPDLRRHLEVREIEITRK